MSLQSKLSRLERRANFAPLSPCPMCELTARFLREWVELAGDLPTWPNPVPYTYESLCAFCGLRETRTATAPDEEAARQADALFKALASGRYCEAWDADAAFCEFYERHEREQLGDDYPKVAALRERFSRDARAIHDRYTPRVPYVCRVEGCTCENAERAA